MAYAKQKKCMKQMKNNDKNAKVTRDNIMSDRCLFLAYMGKGQKIGISTATYRLRLTGSEISPLIDYLAGKNFILKENRSFRLTDKGRDRLTPFLKLLGYIALELKADDTNIKSRGAQMFAYNRMYSDSDTGFGRPVDVLNETEKKILLKIYLCPNTTRDDIAKFSVVIEHAEISDNPDDGHWLEDSEYMEYARLDALSAVDRLIPDFVSEKSGVLKPTRAGRRAVNCLMGDAERGIGNRLPEPATGDKVDAEVFMRRSDIDMAAYYGNDAVFSKLAKEMGAGGSGEKIHA
jgi:hypothetical protein